MSFDMFFSLKKLRNSVFQLGLTIYAGLVAANRLSKFKLEMRGKVEKKWFKENTSSLLEKFFDEVVEEMMLKGWF